MVRNVLFVNPTQFIGSGHGVMSQLDADKHRCTFSLEPWGLTVDFGERKWIVPFANIKAMETL